MSSSVFMKVLESSPHRYDRGILMLTRGRIKEVYLKIAEIVAAPGKLILDIGCGTGNVSLACAAGGAKVVGIDINAEMLEVAREKVKVAGLDDRVELLELGVAELGGRIGEGSLDAAVSCLTFSELTRDERAYALELVLRLLKPGGAILIADEVVPEGNLRRFSHELARLPFAAATYVVTQATTHPLRDPSEILRNIGYVGVESTSLWGGSFAIIRGFKGGGS